MSGAFSRDSWRAKQTIPRKTVGDGKHEMVGRARQGQPG